MSDVPVRGVPLSMLLEDRAETGDESQGWDVVQKVTFAGEIKLRESRATNTKMIVVRPGDVLFSGINAIRGAIARHDVASTAPILATIHYSSYAINERNARPAYVMRLLRS